MEKNANTWKNIIKWLIVLLLIAIVYRTKKELITEAVGQIRHLPVHCSVICLTVTVFYGILEGALISTISGNKGEGVSFKKGVECAFYAAFYKLVTLGSGAGIAEIYYLSKERIPVSRATGMTLIQYIFQKMMITILGIAGLAICLLFGKEQIQPYLKFAVLGVLVSAGITLALFLLSCSEKVKSALQGLIGVLLRRFPEKQISLHKKIEEFNEAGKQIWKDPEKIAKCVFYNLGKLLCWYVIPAVVFLTKYEVNLPLCVCRMAVISTLAGVMVAPAGIGTLEYVFTLFYGSAYGVLAATAVILYRFFIMIVPCLIGIVPVVLHANKKETPSYSNGLIR